MRWPGDMGLLLNGALHWRPRREESSREGEKGEAIAALAFDLEKEKFFLVPGPPIKICPGYGAFRFGVVGEYLCHSHSENYGCNNIIWVMKEYCNKASWVPFITYTSLRITFPEFFGAAEGRVEHVCDFIPQSFKDGRYMLLQFSNDLDVLRWNNNLEESDKAGRYSKEIKVGSVRGSLPYTQTLTSPYVS
ncbi:hypothetical protein Tsubulata_037116 [Turnera subulata]|nr:hypothetical protein Tsubulata_037116 [Turnera subulata]